MKIRLRRCVCVGQSLVPGNAVTFWERDIELPIVPRKKDHLYLAPTAEPHKVVGIDLFGWSDTPRVWVKAADELDVKDFHRECKGMRRDGWTCVEAHEVKMVGGGDPTPPRGPGPARRRPGCVGRLAERLAWPPPPRVECRANSLAGRTVGLASAFPTSRG